MLSQSVKRCCRCKQDLPPSCFNKNRHAKDGLQHYCRSCCKEHNAENWKRNKDRWLPKYREQTRARGRKYARNINLRKKYGVTEKQADQALAAIGGLCEICGKECATGKRLAVDHSHATGLVRGLLCMKCNVGLGKFGDSIALLQAAAEYLSREDSISMQILNSKEVSGVEPK